MKCQFLIAATVALLFVLGSPFGSARAEASENFPLTLFDIYQMARDGDPNIAIARFRVDGAEAERDIARGKNFPQVSLFGDWSRNKINYEGDTLSSVHIGAAHLA